MIKPDECVAVAAAIIRVFVEHGDRTNRKRARLKYLIDSWGIPKFVEEVDKKLAFQLVRFPLERCEPRHPPILHGHVGVFKQAQRGLNYIGAVITVGRVSTRQMRRLADIAQNYGSGEVRLTVWQNLIIPNIPDAFVETVKKNLVRMGFTMRPRRSREGWLPARAIPVVNGLRQTRKTKPSNWRGTLRKEYRSTGRSTSTSRAVRTRVPSTIWATLDCSARR